MHVRPVLGLDLGTDHMRRESIPKRGRPPVSPARGVWLGRIVNSPAQREREREGGGGIRTRKLDLSRIVQYGYGYSAIFQLLLLLNKAKIV